MLRYNSVKTKKKVMVLDAFTGKGNVWEEVNKRHGNITIIGIEKQIDKNKKNTIVGDNRKILKEFDCSSFDVIDLDTYGVPAIQIHDILSNNSVKEGTIVFYTCIVVNKGRLPNLLLNRLGYTGDMVKKVPTLFARNWFDKFCQFIATYGIKKIFDVSKKNGTRKKHYGYFIVGQ